MIPQIHVRILNKIYGQFFWESSSMDNQNNGHDQTNDVEWHQVSDNFISEVVVKELDDDLNILCRENIFSLLFEHLVKKLPSHIVIDDPIDPNDLDINCESLGIFIPWSVLSHDLLEVVIVDIWTGGGSHNNDLFVFLLWSIQP